MKYLKYVLIALSVVIVLLAFKSLYLDMVFPAEGAGFYNRTDTVTPTTTYNAWINTYNKGYFYSTTSADYWDSTKSRWATTSSDYWYTVQNHFSSTSADYWKSVTDMFSTTSANAWYASADRFSTTTNAYWLDTLDKGYFFSTTSATYWVDASTTIPKLYSSNTWTNTNNFTTLQIGGKKVSARWKDKMSIPSATTTDETVKFGSCLESGGNSVTLDKIDTLLASTTAANASLDGITWNIYVANTTSSTSPMSLFDVNQWSYGTATVQSFTPTTSVKTIPAGYCYWFKPVTASTTQIQMFYLNLYGYEN